MSTEKKSSDAQLLGAIFVVRKKKEEKKEREARTSPQ